MSKRRQKHRAGKPGKEGQHQDQQGRCIEIHAGKCLGRVYGGGWNRSIVDKTSTSYKPNRGYFPGITGYVRSGMSSWMERHATNRDTANELPGPDQPTMKGRDKESYHQM